MISIGELLSKVNRPLPGPGLPETRGELAAPKPEEPEFPYKSAVFILEGLKITGADLLDAFPCLTAVADNFPALELVATAQLVTALLKAGKVPILVREANRTPFYQGIKKGGYFRGSYLGHGSLM